MPPRSDTSRAGTRGHRRRIGRSLSPPAAYATAQARPWCVILFAGEAAYCATKFAQVGFAQGLDKELRPHGIKVGTINPGGVKTEFALGKGRTEKSVAESGMLEAEDVAEAVLFACTQPAGSRIIQIQMRTMAEALA